MILHFLSSLLATTLRRSAQALAVSLALVIAPAALASDNGPTQTGQGESGPAIWSLKKGQSTVYLFGSVHLLKPGTEWRTERLDSIIDRADHLVLEVDLANNSRATAQQFMIERGLYGPDRTLSDALPADLYGEVVSAAYAAGVPEAVLERMRPWYAAIVVSMSMIQSLGFDPAEGVEQVIMQQATANGARRTGLETVEEQLSIFADQPEEVGVSMVRDSLRQMKDVSDLLNSLTAAWVRGDLGELDDVLIGGFEPYPMLYKAVVVDRNKRWVPRIAALLEEPGTHLVVVGTAHLVGEDSVIRMLRDQGIKIVRE